MTTRYLIRFVKRDGTTFMASHSFPITKGCLAVMRYYAGPKAASLGKYAGARVEYAPCQYDVALKPGEQKNVGEWKELA